MVRDCLGRPPCNPWIGKYLEHLETLLGRFIAFQDPAQAVAVALWVAHTHTAEAADATPYLAVTSPTKRAGKTRLLELLELLVAEPLRTTNISVAALFRRLDRRPATLLLDEADSIFARCSDGAEDLRALLNAGHRRGAQVIRCVGQGALISERSFQVFGPKAIASINELPDTVMDRSIPIRLARRAPGDRIERFRRRDVEAEAAILATELRETLRPHIDALRAARPSIPAELDDRAADGWEPLLAIADAVGGEWPEKARRAAVDLQGTRREEDVGVLLLGHILEAFEESSSDRLTTEQLLRRLVNRDEGPWPVWWEQALRDAKLRSAGSKLSRLLRPFGISSTKVWAEGRSLQGYERRAFEDAWSRYFPSSTEDGRTEEPTSDASFEDEGLEGQRPLEQEPSVLPSLGYSRPGDQKGNIPIARVYLAPNSSEVLAQRRDEEGQRQHEDARGRLQKSAVVTTRLSSLEESTLVNDQDDEPENS